ncbi:MAG TPA: thioesterase family protein [Woeseiaceae bacterium]|nr:thioesterase family protein [Woeseiaceae bacterium]
MSAFEGVTVHAEAIRPEWIDYNGHMNVAWYVLLFDHGVDGLWDELGLDAAYREGSGGTTFAVECHVNYLRELREGDPVTVTAQLLAWDAKRIHQFQRMYHAGEGWLAATCEWMNLHVDTASRRVSPWPGAVLGRLAAFADRHRGAPWPEQAGHRMRVPEPLGPERPGAD